MKYFNYLWLICSLCFSHCSNPLIPNSGQSEKPNLLIIQTDEHNFRTLGCYRALLSEDQAFVWGEGIKVETPNIDWLAQNGALFTKYYASTPVCSPSRASFVTGLYPHHNGVTKNDIPMNDEVVTFAEVLGKEGYFTGYVGKWHLDGTGKPQWEPKRKFGFEDNRYMFNRGHWKKFEDTPDGPRIAASNNKGAPSYNLDGADEKSFATDFLVDRSIDLINKNKEKPFCLMVAIPDPHGPDKVRPPYDKMYTDLPFEAPRTYYKSGKDAPAWAKKAQKASIDQAQYFGMVKCIDDNVGKVIEFLRSEKLLQNTIVVFTSDHGDLRGEHHRHNKGNPLEASAKIPFIVYYPQKITKGTVVNNAFNTVDFAPGILSLIGMAPATGMQGSDFSKLATNPSNQENFKDITFMRSTGLDSNGNWISAITSRYKLILSKQDDPWLLDLETDPDELINFINESDKQQVVKELASQLQDYAKKFDDPYLQRTKMADDLMELLK